MTVWFVSRHPGAIDWAKKECGLNVDRWVTHIRSSDVIATDIVIGTLPIHIAAEICARGAKFYYLTMNLRADQRGRELAMDEMTQAKCCIKQFVVLPATD